MQLWQLHLFQMQILERPHQLFLLILRLNALNVVNMVLEVRTAVGI